MEDSDEQIDFSKYTDIFQLKKYNDVWLRAITKQLPEKELHKLKNVLNKLDRTELDLKHLHKDDKEMKLQVKEHLNEVLMEYGLFDDDVPVLDHQDTHFNDERINQLWQDAVKEGHFSKIELHSLHNEMRHMEGNMDELHTHAQQTEHYRRNIGENMENDARINQNLIEPINEDNFDVDKLYKMDAQLKDKTAMLNERAKHIEDKVRRKSGKETSEFTDERIFHLWGYIQSSNFTADERETITEELRHFQTQIDKLHHWERYIAKLQEGEHSSSEERLHAQNRIDEYKRKVKKYHVAMAKKMKEYKIEL